MKELTKRQRELVDYIGEFIANNRYSPSYREISKRFGFSSLGSVYKHVNALKRKGVLLGEPKRSRSIAPANVPTPQNQTEVEIPFIGHLVGGLPVQMFPQPKQMTVPKSLVHAPEKTYALRVHGNFLIEEMIAANDILLVEVRQDVHPGETVVALINGHDTIVKKCYPEGTHVRLLSAYAEHHPILLRQDDVLVQAIVIGLIRSYSSST